MLHPLLHLLATQPHLLGNHAQAYGELLGDEVTVQARLLGKRGLFTALAVCFLGVAAVLCGTACMLWAVAPPTMAPLPAVLIIAPLVPAALALISIWLARPDTETKAFGELLRQVEADLTMLREVGAP